MTVGRLLTRRRLLIGSAVVGVPALGVGGTAMYIGYRIYTRPKDHEFTPLVDADGALQIEGCHIEPPGRWQMFWRILELIRLFLPVVVLYYVFGQRDKYYNWWVHKLLAAVERAGPAFVKAGQWTCTRSDLFSPEFRSIFQKLYSEVSIHSFETTKKTIESEMGKPLSEIFQSLDTVPIGSGSIGQVHKGVLVEGGQPVAVKVMHPRVVELIAKDFYIINTVAKWADKTFKSRMEHLEVPVQAAAWTTHLAAQLDFRVEYDHLRLLGENFEGTDYVRIPKGISATQRVLIEEFVPGDPATEEFLRSLPPKSRDILAGKGLNCYCKMLLRDNFLHGDLHPGNILVDARDPHRPQVSLIDVGLCVKMTEREGKLSNDLMSAFVKWDPTLCRDTLLAMGKHQRYTDKKLLKDEMDDLFNRYRPIKGDEEAVVENILQSLFEATRHARVTMDPGFVSIMFSVLVLEGFILSLNPEYNMVQHAAPWLVGEGHLSKALIKNIVKSGAHRLWTSVHTNVAAMTGTTATPDEPYVPRRRPRFDVEKGHSVYHMQSAAEDTGKRSSPVASAA